MQNTTIRGYESIRAGPRAVSQVRAMMRTYLLDLATTNGRE